MVSLSIYLIKLIEINTKRNDSRNVKIVAQKIADFKNITIEEVAKITYENAMKIFEI